MMTARFWNVRPVRVGHNVWGYQAGAYALVERVDNLPLWNLVDALGAAHTSTDPDSFGDWRRAKAAAYRDGEASGLVCAPDARDRRPSLDPQTLLTPEEDALIRLGARIGVACWVGNGERAMVHIYMLHAVGPGAPWTCLRKLGAITIQQWRQREASAWFNALGLVGYLDKAAKQGEMVRFV
jgi:hypothetical protein